MKVEFDVTMTAGKIYDYLLKHAMSTKQGFFTELGGLILMVIYFFTGNLILFCLGALAMLYFPLTLYFNATKQIKNVPYFANKIHYIVSDSGIAIIAGDQKQFQPWKRMYKVMSTTKSIIVYTDEVNACILPKEDMGDKRPAVIQFITTYMPKNKVNLEKMDTIRKSRA